MGPSGTADTCGCRGSLLAGASEHQTPQAGRALEVTLLLCSRTDCERHHSKDEFQTLHPKPHPLNRPITGLHETRHTHRGRLHGRFSVRTGAHFLGLVRGLLSPVPGHGSCDTQNPRNSGTKRSQPALTHGLAGCGTAGHAGWHTVYGG